MKSPRSPISPSFSSSPSSPVRTLDQLLAAGYSLQEIAKKKDHSEKRRRQENCEWADRKSAALKQLVMVRRASEPVIEAVGGRLDDYESSKDGRDAEDLQRSASLGTIRMEQHSTSSMRTITTTHNNNTNSNTGKTTVPGIQLNYRKHAPLPDTNVVGNTNTSNSNSTTINNSTSSTSSNTGTPVAKSRNKVHPLSSSPMRNLLHHLKPLPRVIPNFAPPLVQANNKSNKPKQSSSSKSSSSSNSSSNMGARCA
jgi:hypothetical protein